VKVQRADAGSAQLLALLTDAERQLRSHRGGPELLNAIRRGRTDEELQVDLVAVGGLWLLEDNGRLRGFAICRDRYVEAIYVEPSFRRHGGATTLLTTLRALDEPPVDAFALPGDRATKSLYESIGWKARLLTMRGE